MNYLLDTNAVCEPKKRRPNAAFLDWFQAQDEADLHTSTITLAEVWQGWFNLDETHPDHTELRRFADNLPHAYRVLKFDEAAARKWGEITCEGHDPLPVRDSLIAAIALSRGYRVVSRDTAPFLRAGCKVVNPWR